MRSKLDQEKFRRKQVESAIHQLRKEMQEIVSMFEEAKLKRKQELAFL